MLNLNIQIFVMMIPMDLQFMNLHFLGEQHEKAFMINAIPGKKK